MRASVDPVVALVASWENGLPCHIVQAFSTGDDIQQDGFRPKQRGIRTSIVVLSAASATIRTSIVVLSATSATIRTRIIVLSTRTTVLSTRITVLSTKRDRAGLNVSSGAMNVESGAMNVKTAGMSFKAGGLKIHCDGVVHPENSAKLTTSPAKSTHIALRKARGGMKSVFGVEQ